MSETKRCTKCHEEKPLDQFYHDRRRKDGRHSWCRNCEREYHAAVWRDPTHPAHDAKVRSTKKTNALAAIRGSDYYWMHRESHWRRYSIRLADGTPFLRQNYKDLLAVQGGGCGLCGISLEGLEVHVDHEHRDGKQGPVRALVCEPCNRNRIASHDLESAKKLVAYFESPPALRLSQPKVK